MLAQRSLCLLFSRRALGQISCHSATHRIVDDPLGQPSENISERREAYQRKRRGHADRFSATAMPQSLHDDYAHGQRSENAGILATHKHSTVKVLLTGTL